MATRLAVTLAHLGKLREQRILAKATADMNEPKRAGEFPRQFSRIVRFAEMSTPVGPLFDLLRSIQ